MLHGERNARPESMSALYRICCCRDSRDVNILLPLGLDRLMGPSVGQEQPEQKTEQEANEELEENQETEDLELTGISKENSKSNYSVGRVYWRLCEEQSNFPRKEYVHTSKKSQRNQRNLSTLGPPSAPVSQGSNNTWEVWRVSCAPSWHMGGRERSNQRGV